jgi:hypothetical protein
MDPLMLLIVLVVLFFVVSIGATLVAAASLAYDAWKEHRS